MIRKGPPGSPPAQQGPRVNEQIRASKVRLIGAEGENHDVVSIEEALALAEQAGLDLVEISPTAEPPVCKILDYGKYKYEAQKKANIARKNQKVIEIKEIKMRPTIDTHDYDVKMRAIEKFLGEGDKVKVTLRFRGREMAHQELGMNVLIRVQNDIGDQAKIEQPPKYEGRQIIMVIAPKWYKLRAGKIMLSRDEAIPGLLRQPKGLLAMADKKIVIASLSEAIQPLSAWSPPAWIATARKPRLAMTNKVIVIANPIGWSNPVLKPCLDRHGAQTAPRDDDVAPSP